MKLRLLGATDVFGGLDSEIVERVMEISPVATVNKGTVLCDNAQPRKALFILMEGHFELFRETHDGRRLTIASLLPGAIFGEMALVDQTLGGTCAIALEDSLVSELNWNDLESLLAAYPSVALRIFEVLAYRLEQTRRMLESVVFGDVLGRVAELLLQMADEETQVIEGYCHRELASMVGCLRETFTEALTRFKRTGGVEVGRKWIRIIDRDQLQWVSTHNT